MDSEGPRPELGGAPQIPLTWAESDRPVPRRLLRPLRALMRQEAASAALFFLAAVAALVWANSPWRESYTSLWETEISLRIGSWELHEDLRHWVSDALMAIFFFAVGLEVKHELVQGELRNRRDAIVPVAAALGGMVVPAGLYLAFTAGTEAARGWGIPMATDIAFALGVFALAGRGLPPGLRIFLLTLAVGDDLGAIAVIALFYTDNVSVPALVTAVGLLAAIVVMNRIGVRYVFVYLVLGIAVWLAVFESGVHATIAGALLGLVTPAVPYYPPREAGEKLRRIVTGEEHDEPAMIGWAGEEREVDRWLDAANTATEAVSPQARMSHFVEPWVTWLIVPLFALANAGVALDAESLRAALTDPITLGIVVGLVVGKPLGIAIATLAVARFTTGGIRMRPLDVTAVGGVAGIGFTVALFIASLAFGEGPDLERAKVGILAGSLVAGVIGAVLLRATRRARARAGGPEVVS